MNPVGARQFGHRSVALDRCQRHLRLKARPMLLACLLHLLLPRFRRFLGAGLHLNQLSRFRGPAQAADAETELRGWEIQGDRLRAPTNPIPVAIYPQRRTTTASWQRSILIITALSTLTWAAVVLVVIEALAHL